MHIDFLGLRAFLAIAEHGSFRSAADYLSVSQAALSHRIRKLEEELGAKLFSRTTREVTLTRTGLSLLPKVKESIDILAISLGEIRRESIREQQTVSIGCLPTLASGKLPPVLRAFHQRFPQTQVKVYDLSTHEINELVQEGKVDLGLTIVASQRWDFESEVLFRDAFVLACGPDHPLAGATEVSWSAIRELPLVRVSHRTGNRAIIDDALGDLAEELGWQIEVQHLQTAVAIARQGPAAAIVPAMAFSVNSAKEHGLHLVALKNPCITREIGIVTRRGKPLSRPAQHLRDYIHDSFKRG